MPPHDTPAASDQPTRLDLPLSRSPVSLLQ